MRGHCLNFLVTVFVEIFLRLASCDMEIEFLEDCLNSQIKPTECPKGRILNVKKEKDLKNVKYPLFILDLTWNNNYVLYGNFVFPLHQGEDMHLLEMNLIRGKSVVNRKCFRFQQGSKQEELEIKCLKMVPSSSAELEVSFIQYIEDSTTASNQQLRGELIRSDTFSFNIGQESCKYYNGVVGKSSHFTVWKTSHRNQLAFQYTDTSLNMFAMESEILITELCTGRHDVVFNQTIQAGTSRIDLNATFNITCPWDELLELIVESCSYCYKYHEAGACFDQTIDLRATSLETRYPCGLCDKRALCLDKYCVCGQGFTGDGSRCWPIDNGHNLLEVITGAISGMVFVMLLVLVAVLYFRKMRYKKVLCSDEKENQIQNNERMKFIIEKETLSPSSRVTKTPRSPNCVLVLYHPDSRTHQQCVNNLFHQLREQKIRVCGLPEDFHGNWINLAENVDHLFSGVVIILSPGLCELLRLYKKDGTRNCEEERRWKLLLQDRFYESVPCKVLDKIGGLVKENDVYLPNIVIASFQDKVESSKLRSILQDHSFLRGYHTVHLNVKYYQIRVSDMCCNTVDVNSMIRRLRALSANDEARATFL